MSSPLDPFRPTPEIYASVRRELIESGIPLEEVEAKAEAIYWTVAAMQKWLFSHEKGVAYVISSINMETWRGGPGKNYFVRSAVSDYQMPVKPEDVCFFQGVWVRGEILPVAQVVVTDRTKEQCERCGTPCLAPKKFEFSGDDEPTWLCNACVIQHELGKVRLKGDISECEKCPAKKCPYHPTHSEKAEVA